MVSIARVSVAAYFGNYVRSARFSVLQLFEHNYTGSLAHDEASASLVERQRRQRRIFRQAESLTVYKSADSELCYGSFCTTCNNSVGISVHNRAVSLADRICRGCARRYSGEGRSLCIVFYSNVA